MKRFRPSVTLGAGAIGILALAGLLRSADSANAAKPGPAVVPLREEEKADLLHMREEEKLARDVYIAMYARWEAAVFSNITGSEQTHMDSVANLLAKYKLADPVAGLAPGQFATEYFQNLYTQLVETGNQSIEAALEVGGAIEEIDILDLWECIDRTTRTDIRRVYQNLEAASENHLRAFVSEFTSRGVTYEPKYLTQDQYDQIIGH